VQILGLNQISVCDYLTFRVEMSCEVVCRYQGFGEISCLHLQGRSAYKSTRCCNPEDLSSTSRTSTSGLGLFYLREQQSLPHSSLHFRVKVASSDRNLLGRKLVRSLKKVTQQLNVSMEQFKNQLFNDSYGQVSRR
jgi:hypothetical protein